MKQTFTDRSPSVLLQCWNSLLFSSFLLFSSLGNTRAVHPFQQHSNLHSTQRLFLDWRQKALLNVPCNPIVLTATSGDRTGHIHLGFLQKERHRRDRDVPWSTMWCTTGPGNSGTQGKSQQHRQTTTTRVLLWGCKGSAAKLSWQNQGK